MKVKVELGGMFREKLGKSRELEVEPGSTVEDVLNLLGITERAWIILIRNGRHAKLDEELSDGDELAIFPPVGGGTSGEFF